VDLGLTGKRALVLGSSRGLGLGIAEALAAEGADVVVCGRSEEKLRAVALRITGQGQGVAHPVVVDLAARDSAARLADAALAALGRVDILVNNSGGPPPGPVTAVTDETWRGQFETMVLRIFGLTALLVPGMRERRWGRILTLTSSGVVQPIPQLGISNALRAALVTWSKTLATELAAEGVTVNTLVPGRIQTQRVDELDAAAAARQGTTVEEVARQARATIPVGRYGEVRELAAVAAFLVGEPASYVTGSVIRVDGGLIRAI